MFASHKAREGTLKLNLGHILLEKRWRSEVWAPHPPWAESQGCSGLGHGRPCVRFSDTGFHRTKSECASQPGEGSTKAWRSICVNDIAPWILTYTSFSVARAVFVILTWRPDLLFSMAVVRGSKSWNVGNCRSSYACPTLPQGIWSRHKNWLNLLFFLEKRICTAFCAEKRIQNCKLHVGGS